MARPREKPALQAWLDEFGTLSAAAAARPGAEALRGRGTVHLVDAPTAGRWVVRHYHRGGAVASVLGDRYLRIGTPRPFREFRLGRALEELEVPTPEHVGAAVYTAGPWYRGDLVTRYVPGSHDLAAVLFPGSDLHAAPAEPELDPEPGLPDREAAMEVTGSLIRLLHDRGVSHPDLNLKNVLITGPAADTAPTTPASEAGSGDVRALVLDLDRATLRARLSDRARRAMLERFWRSARKWETRTGRALEPALRRAFDRGYAG